MKTKKVIVLPWDPAWARDFEAIRRELEAGLGSFSLRIEHVGSTSVEGLAAKPIIDLDVVIRDDQPLGQVIEALAQIGYIHEGDLGIPGREAFRYEGKPHLRKHHMYVCRESSRELHRHTAFRDQLRLHPEAAAEYSRVKLEAAALYPEDIDGYMAHKSGCIQTLYTQWGLE